MTRLVVTRGSGWVDHLRAYNILVDDEKVGRVRDGGIWHGEISPGERTVRCTVDWTRTEPLYLSVEEGDEIRLHVEVDTVSPFEILLGRHVSLRRVS